MFGYMVSWNVREQDMCTIVYVEMIVSCQLLFIPHIISAMQSRRHAILHGLCLTLRGHQLKHQWLNGTYFTVGWIVSFVVGVTIYSRLLKKCYSIFRGTGALISTQVSILMRFSVEFFYRYFGMEL